VTLQEIVDRITSVQDADPRDKGAILARLKLDIEVAHRREQDRLRAAIVGHKR
jgi:hypothetical protein